MWSTVRCCRRWWRAMPRSSHRSMMDCMRGSSATTRCSSASPVTSSMTVSAAMEAMAIAADARLAWLCLPCVLLAQLRYSCVELCDSSDNRITVVPCDRSSQKQSRHDAVDSGQRTLDRRWNECSDFGSVSACTRISSQICVLFLWLAARWRPLSHAVRSPRSVVRPPATTHAVTHPLSSATCVSITLSLSVAQTANTNRPQ